MAREYVENRFTNYPAQDDATAAAHTDVRERCKALALEFEDTLPDGREKTIALDRLEEVMFWANAAIARAHVST